MMENILLYSSGFDSELYRLLLNPEGLLFFRSGAKYEKKELEQLKRMKSHGMFGKSKVIIDSTFNFSKVEDENLIVPLRNIYYLLKAFDFSSKVYLGVVKNDVFVDKQRHVLNAVESLLHNYYYDFQTPNSWNNEYPEVLTPYRKYTKTDLLRTAISEGLDVSHIPALRSCYEPDSEIGCGKCACCVAKAVALANNDMFSYLYFDNDPRITLREMYRVRDAEIMESGGEISLTPLEKELREEGEVLLGYEG